MKYFRHKYIVKMLNVLLCILMSSKSVNRNLRALMINRSDTRCTNRVLRCITSPTTTYLINNKIAEISDRQSGHTKQFTSDAPMMERIFKCQFSELIADELRQSRYRLGRRRSILARTCDMNGHSIAAKPVINAPLRLPHGRSGAGPVWPGRPAQNGWKTTER